MSIERYLRWVGLLGVFFMYVSDNYYVIKIILYLARIIKLVYKRCTAHVLSFFIAGSSSATLAQYRLKKD